MDLDDDNWRQLRVPKALLLMGVRGYYSESLLIYPHIDFHACAIVGPVHQLLIRTLELPAGAIDRAAV